MLFTRNETFRGRMPINLPQLYACAQCGGVLVHQWVNATTEMVRCSQDPKHTGFRSATADTQARVSTKQQQQVQNTREVSEIARIDKRVAEAVRLKREKDNKDLFG